MELPSRFTAQRGGGEHVTVFWPARVPRGCQPCYRGGLVASATRGAAGRAGRTQDTPALRAGFLRVKLRNPDRQPGDKQPSTSHRRYYGSHCVDAKSASKHWSRWVGGVAAILQKGVATVVVAFYPLCSAPCTTACSTLHGPLCTALCTT